MKLRTLFMVLCAPLLLMQQSCAENRKCGNGKNNRIVAGKYTDVNEFPMMAGLVETGTGVVFCGATILANDYVLSCAHCVYKRDATSLQVLVGDWDYTLNNDTQYSAFYAVKNIVSHPDYDPNTNLNDISIIRTDRSIEYNPAVGPVCLPLTNLLLPDNSSVIAVGWGTTEFGGPKSSKLKKVDLKVSNNLCKDIKDNILCTFERGSDACQNDSGGPIYFMIDNHVHLVGVISHGIGCATNNTSKNTRVTSFVPWIKKNTPGAVYY